MCLLVPALVDKYSIEELQNLAKQANSYKDLVKLLGYSSSNGNVYKTVQKRIEQYNIDISHFQEYHAIKRNEENVFCQDSTASQKVLREWYLKGKYTEYKCAICGLPAKWQGKPLTLTLDHKNGINGDNRLENLRWVCPNCDRQLPTYSRGAKGLVQKEQKTYYCIDCGKEISKYSIRCKSCAAKMQPKKVLNFPTREVLKEKIRNQSFLSIGAEYGVTDNAIRKWCISYSLPSKKTEIKKYSDQEWEQI